MAGMDELLALLVEEFSNDDELDKAIQIQNVFFGSTIAVTGMYMWINELFE